MGDEIVTVDVAELGEVDVSVIDALARLALTVRRSGMGIRLENASDCLTGLAGFMGLSEVLGVEAHRHPE